ncbi:putative permease [Thiorhodovibrio frisius]|uniref:Putative permease n=2 Tax=Thiorhodovibrio frisius TaxID=631362 RepID=H8Z147_9GAMM|nr:putative permease [Thiorhodovibrio frisius]WPL24769.1 Transport of quorum-sensing signal protein [Thiorhodovibrio frisius]
MDQDMDKTPDFSPAGRFLIMAGALVVLVAGLRAASYLVTPFLLSIFIAVLAASPLRVLRRLGLPRWAAMLVIAGVLTGVGLVVGTLFSDSLNTFNQRLPSYQTRLLSTASDLQDWVESHGLELPDNAMSSLIDPPRVMGLMRAMVSGFSTILANALLVMVTVIFILLEADGLPNKVRLALRTPEESIDQAQQVMRAINRYMALKASTSLLTGVLVWILLTIIGVDFAPMWGTIAFLLNFVPTIGSFIATVPAVLLALVQIDLGAAFMTSIGFAAINLTIGNFVEPKIMGRGVGLSTLVVFLSLVFWGYVLGVGGMFLSVPLTMALKIALSANPQTRPIAILLGPENQAAAAGDAHGSAEDSLWVEPAQSLDSGR